jgi:hypothetical protein
VLVWVRGRRIVSQIDKEVAMKVIAGWKRSCVWPLLAAALIVTQPAAAAAADVTVLVNGSFNAYPPWMDDW